MAKKIGMVEAVVCQCGGGCRPIAPSVPGKQSSNNPYAAPQQAGSVTAARRDYRSDRAVNAHDISYVSALAYPFSLNGVLLMGIGSILYTVIMFMAAFAFMYGGIAAFLVTGFTCAYLQKIVRSSTDGEVDMPDWPEFTDMFSDIIAPGIQFMLGMAFCFAPAILYGIFVQPGILMVLLALAGLIYLPIGLLYVTLNDSVFAILNVHILIPSIGRIVGHYLGVWLALSALYVIGIIAALILGLIPILGLFIANLFAFYLSIVQFRLIGLMYFKNEEQLDWF